MATQYYSGQGRVYVGDRNASGGCDALQELGNVPNLEISVEITKFEHKESQSGARAIDVTIVQERKGTFTMTMESLSIKNLSTAFWGTESLSATGADVSLAAIARTATPSTDKPGGASSTSAPAIEYRMPIGAGIVNVKAVTIESAPSGGDVYEFGLAPGDGNDKNGYVDEVNGVIVVYSEADQASAPAAAATISTPWAIHITSFTRVATDEAMDAFTETSQQKYLRFEGLNTIDDTPIIVDIYKADLDPLSGYGLINEEIGSFEITGSILLDELQPASSQFFKQVNVPVTAV